jgi:hypothetical protein
MHFAPTLPEREGWVDRSKLLGIQGRSRKPQIALAKEKNIVDYPCPAGGCLLTDKLFAEKLADYFAHCETPSVKDMALLKVGRHFRDENGRKTIVGRDEREGDMMERLAPPAMHLYYPVNFGGPHILADEPYSDAIRELFYKYGKVPPGGEASIEWVFAGEKKICIL